ncbi:NAD(P)/FAD-dependent oxidoreductase [Parapedobacter sp. ISTM3]|uniref:NADH:ubiquinone reductase (non-electrogenic) n=1 Tax=Parapedobacter luteus TaxID=623280 RepID=A0A1T5B301_9SPHI|nr:MULTISPECIES: NAD(P)/FAD-dependent oxidoreductase [Parapedobacter]MBK1440483.1 NAD(P)/FAD-dependent oxidoreductase [Parapedobacter sp. ISTM3]SKB41612.1 NADH dehydrogenase [Parapedobacter luteus]
MKTQHTDSKFPRVVIIGGGFGGIEVAKKLKNKEVEVLLLDRNNHHTFQPLLYQVATGTLDAPSIAFPLRKMFRKQENFTFRIADVQSIDGERKLLNTDIGPIAYDYLVIATGATTNFFGNKDLEYYAMPMKSVREAVNIRSFLLQNIEESLLKTNPAERAPFLNFVVVGGGPTGVELSGAIAEIRNHILSKDYPELKKEDMNVYLVEGLSKILANLSPQASEKAELYLKELGVKVLLNVQVTGYDGEVITFADGKRIQTKTVLWSAGVMGQFPAGISQDLVVRGNRIRVDEECRVIGMNDVFAIGDVAAMITDELPRGHPGVAPVAQQQGRFVAKNIVRLLNNQPTEKFKYFDKGSMATIGRNKAVVDIGKIRFQGFFAWWIWMFVHLMSLVGFRNRVVTFINWAINYLTFNAGIRLIIHKYRRPPKPVAEVKEVNEAHR